ncbi:hypothetical protein GOQ30_06405 [Flavobacterium sp. TP390]|uniref:DUF202 domain-containing protein n=1 Tax=Flavobacterium profundi TaxID=1774945 RepID=A0A6I4IGH0_9FLAO|nr:hypothetical protein [Flavobacterium profundi]MVO08793.1 hypothetical protein [Flavobacterium profundi]
MNDNSEKIEERINDLKSTGLNLKLEAHKNFFKHLDRINDRLFTLNLSVLAGVIAIFRDRLYTWEIIHIFLILINLCLYGFVEYLFIDLYIKEYHNGVNVKSEKYFLKIKLLTEILTFTTIIIILYFIFKILFDK